MCLSEDKSEPSVSELGTGRVSRCRHHNRRAYYRYGHSVNTAVRRWQNFAKDGSIVNRRESGSAFSACAQVAIRCYTSKGMCVRRWTSCVSCLISHAFVAAADNCV